MISNGYLFVDTILRGNCRIFLVGLIFKILTIFIMKYVIKVSRLIDLIKKGVFDHKLKIMSENNYFIIKYNQFNYILKK